MTEDKKTVKKKPTQKPAPKPQDNSRFSGELETRVIDGALWYSCDGQQFYPASEIHKRIESAQQVADANSCHMRSR